MQTAYLLAYQISFEAHHYFTLSNEISSHFVRSYIFRSIENAAAIDL